MVAGRYFAGYYSGGLRTLPSPATGGREGRGERCLNHCQPGRASASPADRPSPAVGERITMGDVGSQEKRSCLVRAELVASRSEAEFYIWSFSRLCKKNKKISPIGGYLLEIMREIT